MFISLFSLLLAAALVCVARGLSVVPPKAPPRVHACSCGEVVLHVNSPILGVCHCHCAGCRAATGAAFSSWGCVPLAATHFSAWSTLKLYQRVHSADGPRANRYFCGNCGCSVAMSYPATGAWAEPNTLWLSAAFFPDADAQGFGNAVHMYPEERPPWCTIDRDGCDGESLTYMGGDHVCVIRDNEEDSALADAVLQLGGRAGTPLQDPAAVLPVPQAEAFRLRGAAPPPAEVARDAVLVEPTPAWALCGPCSASRAAS